jgi:aspartyl-tRNA(Asn)/glutamyl-tRNA(Gln) amidotransferase subunit B
MASSREPLHVAGEATYVVPALAFPGLSRMITPAALAEYDAAQLTQSREMSDYFEAAVAAGASPKVAGNWIINIAGSSLSIERFSGLLALVEKNVISGSIAKTVFDAMWVGEGDADAIIAKRGLTQISDAGEIERIVDGVLAKNASAVAQYRGGKSTAFGFLVGQWKYAAEGESEARERTAQTRARHGLAGAGGLA